MLSLKYSHAQNSQQQKPKITYLGQFDAGHPNSGIYKVFDPTDDVLCYILMPEVLNSKKINNVTTYESNNLGSISCFKVNLPTVQNKPVSKK